MNDIRQTTDNNERQMMDDDERTTTDDDERMTYDRRQHTTHLQPYKQLLMGWIVGGTAITTMGSTTREGAGGI
jgi:hypothetical protein